MFRLFSVTLLFSTLILFSCKSDTTNSNTTPQSAATPTVDTATGMPIQQPNPWKNAACDLLTDDEFCKIFNVDIKRDFANRSTLPDRGYCLRTWKKPDWREREVAEAKNPNVAANPESALALEIIDFGTNPSAQAQFDQTKKDRINGYDTDVADLGDGALWSTRESMLLIKKNHLFLQIKLDHTDKAADNLPLAKEVAMAALRKM